MLRIWNGHSSSASFFHGTSLTKPPMKIIHTAVLLPVLLGGCSLSHQQQTNVDARQFVEGQISTQIQRIAEAQKSLQQASGTIKSKVLSPRKKLAPVVASKTSSGAGQTSSPLILQDLSTIKSPGTQGTTAVFRPPTRSSAVPTPTISAPPHTPVSKLLANKEKNLIASPSSKPMMMTSPASAVMPAPKIWRIEAGSTLKDTLFNWAAAEKCIAPGITTWTVAWQTPVNYRIDAPLQFKGDFLTALNSLFTLYGSAKVPLYAGTRSAQCVVSVDDKEIQ